MNAPDIIHTFPKEEIFVYGDVEQLHDLLIVKNVDAWRALPENIRKHLMCTTEWQYYIADGMVLPNLIINDVEIQWTFYGWMIKDIHTDLI
jgi:hypothetical protein